MSGPGGMRGFSIWTCQCPTEPRIESRYTEGRRSSRLSMRRIERSASFPLFETRVGEENTCREKVLERDRMPQQEPNRDDKCCAERQPCVHRASTQPPDLENRSEPVRRVHYELALRTAEETGRILGRRPSRGNAITVAGSESSRRHPRERYHPWSRREPVASTAAKGPSARSRDHCAWLLLA